MEGKPFMGEVELPRTPRKVKPAVQERLENTPKKSTTLEHIQTKLKTAEERRVVSSADCMCSLYFLLRRHDLTGEGA